MPPGSLRHGTVTKVRLLAWRLCLLWLALLAYGFGWMLLATITWQYGVSHLESSRAGVILLAELVVSVGTALLFGGEQLTPMGWAGGALIAAAALAEAVFPPAPVQPVVQPTPPTP